MTAEQNFHEYCVTQWKSQRRSITVFGVNFSPGPREQINRYFFDAGSINITTIIKEAPGCRGNLRQRTCTLKQATVEYDVHLTNDTIALRSGAGYGYQLAERANASLNAYTNATSPGNDITWRPRQDNVVALTPSYTLGSSIWSHFFSLLYEPMRVNLTLDYGVAFDRFIDCVSEMTERSSRYSNTSCPLYSRMHRRDLAKEYAVEPYNYSAVMRTRGTNWDAGTTVPAECGVYWHDPMQVCNAAKCKFTINQNSFSKCPSPFSDSQPLLCPYEWDSGFLFSYHRLL